MMEYIPLAIELFKRHAWIRAVVYIAVAALFVWYLNDKYNTAIHNAYDSGYNAAYAKVVQDGESQYTRITGSLTAIFDKHTQVIMDSLQKDKEQRNEIEKLLQTGVYVNGDCHNVTGIGLLNEQIRKRNNALQPPATVTQ